MALTDYKVSEADFSANDIAGLSDRPNADGMSASQLKERFDAGAKKVVTPKLNALIDELVSQKGASGIGVTPIEGLSGYDIQNVLIAIKMLLDTKKPTETADIEIGKKFDAAEAQSLVKSISFAEGTGIFTITKYDGTVETIDTAIEKVALDVQLEGQQFVLTLADGTKQRVDLSAFLTQTEVKSSDTITLAIENGAIVARIANGSVKLAHLNAEVTAYFEAKTQQAVSSAAEAKVSEQNALISANAAEQAKQSAQNNASVAEAAAVRAEKAAEEAEASGGGGGVGRFEMHFYPIEATTEGQTHFTIPLETFDASKDDLTVIDGQGVLLPGIGYTVAGRTITMTQAWGLGDGGGIKILRNATEPELPTETFSGALITDGSIPAEKLAEEFVKSDGSVAMTGDLQIINDTKAIVMADEFGAHLDATNLNSTERRNLFIDCSTGSDFIYSLGLLDIVNGEVIKRAIVFGEHNKPVVSYMGNGSSAERIIPVEGVGKAILVTNAQFTAIVYTEGAIVFDGAKTSVTDRVSIYRVDHSPRIHFNGTSLCMVGIGNDKLNTNGYWFTIHRL